MNPTAFNTFLIYTASALLLVRTLLFRNRGRLWVRSEAQGRFQINIAHDRRGFRRIKSAAGGGSPLKCWDNRSLLHFLLLDPLGCRNIQFEVHTQDLNVVISIQDVQAADKESKSALLSLNGRRQQPPTVFKLFHSRTLSASIRLGPKLRAKIWL